jgi:predicted tellurium resistance membrane protein TerC
MIDMKMFRSSDPWALIVIVLSFGLFFLALILKGFTHDLLLEAGVFLVSVKLILMAKKNTETENRVERHLTEIKELLASRYSRSAN